MARGFHAGADARVSAHEPVEDEWGAPAVPADRPADTSGFFAARQQAEGNGACRPAFEPQERQFQSEAQPLQPESQATSGSDDAIYQRMLSEWLVDPSDLANSTDLNWESVWDSGWSAAEAAEETPVQQHTEEGLPVREPGARLVPGTAESAGSEAGDHRNGGAHRNADGDEEVASAAEFGSRSGRIIRRRSSPAAARPRCCPREYQQPFRWCSRGPLARARDQRNR